MKDLVWKIPSNICDWMEVEISSNVKFFKLYPRGRESINWRSIRVFRLVRSQSTAEIFLAHNHTGGVHNALVTEVKHEALCVVPKFRSILVWRSRLVTPFVMCHPWIARPAWMMHINIFIFSYWNCITHAYTALPWWFKWIIVEWFFFFFQDSILTYINI